MYSHHRLCRPSKFHFPNDATTNDRSTVASIGKGSYIIFPSTIISGSRRRSRVSFHASSESASSGKVVVSSVEIQLWREIVDESLGVRRWCLDPVSFLVAAVFFAFDNHADLWIRKAWLILSLATIGLISSQRWIVELYLRNLEDFCLKRLYISLVISIFACLVEACWYLFRYALTTERKWRLPSCDRHILSFPQRTSMGWGGRVVVDIESETAELEK